MTLSGQGLLQRRRLFFRIFQQRRAAADCRVAGSRLAQPALTENKGKNLLRNKPERKFENIGVGKYATPGGGVLAGC